LFDQLVVVNGFDQVSLRTGIERLQLVILVILHVVLNSMIVQALLSFCP